MLSELRTSQGDLYSVHIRLSLACCTSKCWSLSLFTPKDKSLSCAKEPHPVKICWESATSMACCFQYTSYMKQYSEEPDGIICVIMLLIQDFLLLTLDYFLCFINLQIII